MHELALHKTAEALALNNSFKNERPPLLAIRGTICLTNNFQNVCIMFLLHDHIATLSGRTNNWTYLYGSDRSMNTWITRSMCGHQNNENAWKYSHYTVA